MRQVAFGKAVQAGVLGALAWEAAVRLLIAAGVPLFDLLHLLGTMVLPHAAPWQWWLAGVGMHLLAGAVWAIFYAYFFFYTFDCAPALQGLIFATFPFVLAGVATVPQMGLMNPTVHPDFFALREGWGGPVTLAMGHAIYGLVLGALYTHPVGHPVRRMTAHG